MRLYSIILMLPYGRSKLAPRHAPISSSSSPAASCPLYAVFVFILCQWNREWFFQGGRLYARRLAYIMVYYIINAIEWINWLKQFYNLSKHVHDQQQLRACAVLGVPRWSLDIGHGWRWWLLEIQKEVDCLCHWSLRRDKTSWLCCGCCWSESPSL